ncbi:uncharacterized protein JCM6883_001069 [Sporobolomyces salmoneus]|uniref:uncharacterized protein n=1 Tax=Sporobolomyces salmoneus TaxID=183962 RepID=UPI00317DBB56
MERLPFELLNHIFASPLNPKRYSATEFPFISLSNEQASSPAAEPVLYRDPVLLSDWRANYEKTLGNRVNPWLLKSSGQVDKQWWMPKSLGFDYAKPTKKNAGNSISNYGFRRSPSFLACRQPLVWSNLTSLHASRFAQIETGFLANLLGPGQQSRHTLQSLYLDGSLYHHALPFLFDATNFVRAGAFLETDWPSDDDNEFAEDWERHEAGQSEEEAWGWGEASPKLIQSARTDYEIWSQHYNFDKYNELNYFVNQAQIHSRPPSPYPFSALTDLHLNYSGSLNHMLIFYTPSFPVLRILMLYGSGILRPGSETVDWATVRYSITREKGRGYDYKKENGRRSRFQPLSEEEILAYPLKPYRGPNLLKLKLR